MIDKHLEALANKLRRKAINTCSKWSTSYRVIKAEPWEFKYRPWLKEIHDCQDALIACQKSAQMGFSETAINRTLFKIDIQRRDVLYLLPTTKPDAYDFSNSRFDPALEESEHIRKMFSDTKNIGLKRSGSCCLYIRGTGGDSGLKSIPVSDIVFDEINEMDETQVRLAFERVSGQMGSTSIFMLSTPTVPNKGVSLYYQDSTQDHFMFPCPACGRTTELTLECLIVTADVPSDPKIKDSYLQCKECKAKLAHEDKINFLSKGLWVPTFTNKNNRGFSINQLYSMTSATSPAFIAKNYLEAMSDSAFEAEFHNSKMGMPFVPKDSAITESMILACLGKDSKTQTADTDKVITMGVDVGKVMHLVICEWTIQDSDPQEIMKACSKKIIYEGTVEQMTSLDVMMRNYKVDFCVIDALPETRSCIEFANRNFGKVKLCYYNTGDKAQDLVIHPDAEHKVTVNRTLWLDIAMGRIKRKNIEFPRDLSEEFKSHFLNMFRIIRKDPHGNPRSFWESQGADHFCHSNLYSEVALKVFALTCGNNENLSGVY